MPETPNKSAKNGSNAIENIENEISNLSLGTSRSTRSAKKSIWNPIYDEPTDQNASMLKPKLLLDAVKLMAQKVQLHEIEKARLAQLKQEEADRLMKFIQHDLNQQKRHAERTEAARKNLQAKNLETEARILQAIQEQDLEAQEFNERQSKETNFKLKSMRDKFHDFKKREEELRQKKTMIESIMASQANFRKYADSVCKLLQSLDEATYPPHQDNKKQTSHLIKSYDSVIKNINAGILTEVEVNTVQQMSKDMEELFSQMVENVKAINDQALAAEAMQKEREKAAQAELQAKLLLPPPPPPPGEPPAKDTVDNTQHPISHQLRPYISAETYRLYDQIKTFYEQYQKEVKPLLESEALKKYRFNCQKAINIPANAINAVNQQHMIDKYQKLDTMLSGGVGSATGGVQVSASEHPLGKGFCTMLLAKRFAGQADAIMSSNMQTAFGMAAVLITLWQKFPDLGKLFLYYLYKECPYMVPYFLPQLEGQSDEDYMKSLGFRFKDSVVENREQYLKHIAGTTRLYAAVLVTRPRVGVQAAHPHSLENGWRWLTDILNLDPQPDVCATILTEFLQVAGYHLWQAYGRQFAKLMVLMQTQYMPKLARVDQGGPKSRLEKLLADIISNGKIDPPEGMLSPNFW